MTSGSPLHTFQSTFLLLIYIDVVSFETAGWYIRVSPTYFSSTDGFEIKHPIMGSVNLFYSEL